ncbi:MAG: galactokinase [Acidobacteria bacterium]|nr:MAG: galactokinase [Acidobacteriota bacterium]
MTTDSEPAVRSKLLESFATVFPDAKERSLRVFRAPGRVNLIGEHTDYNDGFVMPMAIDFEVRSLCETNRSGKLFVHSIQQQQTVDFTLDETTPAARGDWSDYVRGVQLQLSSGGLHLSGVSLLIDGQVPIGAGLSSSAALEIVVALALLDAMHAEMDRTTLARLCQRAENEFVGARCGIMDQFASANSKAGHAMLLDCRSLQATYVPVPEHVALVICNTMVKHSVATGEYNQRRGECEECVRYFQRFLPHVSSLRDITEEDFRELGTGLPMVLSRRAKHVISENLRVLQAGQALREGDLQTLGKLMYSSHASLRDDFQVSCPELDLLVELARRFPGVYGSRMTGGGFGGCTVNLVEKTASAQFVNYMARSYYEKTGMQPDIYVTTAADGAGPIDNSQANLRRCTESKALS